jgi:hypothetical protein
MGNRPHVILPANEITINDIYSYPKHHGLIIEDVHYKPDKDKILTIMLVNSNVILTSLNEKDVPKSIMNMCKRKRLGRIDVRQNKIKELAPNCNMPVDLNRSVYDINIELLKNKNREEVLKILKHNKPPDIQIISWVLPNVDVRNISFADHIMRRWSKDYFYEILSLSGKGQHRGKPQFATRRSYSPVPKICSKLGLKTKDSYLVKTLLQNEEYKTWATKKLDSDECKILNIKKERKRKQVSVRKASRRLDEF